MPIRVARKRPDAYQHGDLRAALVQAGLKLLSEGGVPALTLRAAAQLAGVSHAAPYRHFRDKDAMIAAIAEEGFRMLTAQMRLEIAAAGGDAFARLRATAWGYVSFARAHPGYFRTMFGAALGDACDSPSSSLNAAGQESFGVLREQVVEGVRRGRLRKGDPDDLSLAAWSMVHGLSQLFVDGQLSAWAADEAAARALVDSAVGHLENGLRAG
jgi:AcrR family transcriptional regulator